MPDNTSPYYTRYAALQGLTVEACQAADAAKWPGGAGAGFILFMSAAWRAFGMPLIGIHAPRKTEADRQRFAVWLSTWEPQAIDPVGHPPSPSAAGVK